MIYSLSIPTSFEDNEAVRVLEWHGAPGDVFAAGALIVEVETHKALVEIRGEAAGVLRQVLCQAGDWCPLGGVLALLSDDPDEPLTPTDGAWPAAFSIG
ncbi:MAG: lipoyl domain-containing protein [Alphaproteobacteria bacterium]|nr:lipoyl domain-containing protein [Alphaproteobacteria bacterium]MBU1516790.1 lipoyl domain-containing protein [Alphaproteobacteria bacterium]MBU2092484.1 lipoyl domain-containing protein [Alphaproteobacteria bacterium]MBU2152385.1 lipoyl domain-containing protein [Alphaproteobacteria bacterium]MBU2305596.1 lipoyl domain-containing protein [Alphaproteobacteria bacterium]